LQWDAISGLVWTWSWLWCIDAAHFVEHPMRWSIDSLQMFLWSSSHIGF
jgi:hypothetical protein